jgi:hypothetical protein
MTDLEHADLDAKLTRLADVATQRSIAFDESIAKGVESINSQRAVIASHLAALATVSNESKRLSSDDRARRGRIKMQLVEQDKTLDAYTKTLGDQVLWQEHSNRVLMCALAARCVTHPGFCPVLKRTSAALRQPTVDLDFCHSVDGSHQPPPENAS